jgi:5,10-methylenetetrahydromethanopterin reductase
VAVFGLELHEYLDAPTIVDEARQGERLGYASVWLGDSQLIWRELHALLGAVATVTERVWLGSGVTNPLTRHPTVTASALATLQELSRGRAVLGTGVGYTSARTLGLAPATRAALAAHVATLRALLAGEEVPAHGRAMRLAYADPAAVPAIVVGASGPKMLRLAGEIGDGAILTGRARAGPVLDLMLGELRAGREGAGRADRPFQTCLGVATAVDDDRERALAAVRPHVAASALVHPRWPLSEAAREASARVQGVYTYDEHMSPSDKFAALIPDEVVQEFAIAGTPDECIAQARDLFAAGIDEITIRPFALAGGTRAATTEAFARDVMSAFPRACADPRSS